MIRKLAFAFGLMMCCVTAEAQTTPTTATSFEEAVALYQDGNYADALPLAQTYANKGDARAMTMLGNMFQMVFMWTGDFKFFGHSLVQYCR